MKHSDGGKGDSPRKQQDQKAYEEGWDRIFSKKHDKPTTSEPVELLQTEVLETGDKNVT
jgi:hypothetical protein